MAFFPTKTTAPATAPPGEMEPGGTAVPRRFDPKAIAALRGLPLRARYVMDAFWSGLHQSPFHGMSVEFNEYRDYNPGDELRHIDWRLYARGDRLCVKKYEQETIAQCCFICDSSASMLYRGDEAWGSKMDVMATSGAALAWLLLKQGDAPGLLTWQPAPPAPKGRAAKAPSPAGVKAGKPASTAESAPGYALSYLPPSSKPGQLGQLLKRWETLAPTGPSKLGDLLTHAARFLRRRSMLFIFSDLLDPAEEIARPCRELRFAGHDCLLFHTLDRDELLFPFSGEASLEDPETGARRQVDADRARERYLQRFEAHMAEHRKLFRSLDFTYALLRTDEDPAATLRRALGTRRKR